MHPSRSDHGSTRGGSARRSDDSSRGIQGLGAPRRGVSSSPLWSSTGLARGPGDLDEGRIGGFERQHALLYRIYGMLECATKGQMLGLSDSDARPDAHWLPAEASAVIALHREAAALETARTQHKELALARAVPARRSTRRPFGVTSQPRQAARTGAKAQRPKEAEQIQTLMSSFSRNRVHEICQRRDRHSSFPSRLEAASDPAAPTPYPPRSTSRDCCPHCCLVPPSTVGLGPHGETVPLPACMQRRIRRGAVLASRLDPLAISGDKRGRCEALFYAVINGTSISGPQPVNFSCDPENWAYGQATSESTAKDHFRSYQLPRSCCSCTAPRLASRMRDARFLPSCGPQRAW